MKFFLISCFFFLLRPDANCQFYESGQDPASIRWMQIKTNNFQIIFPSTFDSVANKLANNLEYLYTHVAKSLNHQPKKISVILHSFSAASNGFVTLAPKRMELFTTPPQDTYGQDWTEQLAIHELRHVVQIDKLNQGLTRMLSIIFGEQGTGAIAGLIPRWFYEGDAVFTETVLTHTGRGRMGSFTMEMKSLIAENPKPFSFEKMALGSYKNYVPNPYNFGYALVANTRHIYGDSIFANNLSFTARNPYSPFAFNRSFKKQTKYNDLDLYQQTYHSIKTDATQAEPSNTSNAGILWLKKNKKDYTNYRFPQFINDTTLFAVKSGIDQQKQFIFLYKNGKEKIIHTPGDYHNDRISLVNNTLVWAEEIPDIRWTNRSYSNLKILDLTSGKLRMLTHKTRYFGPALSPDKQQVAVVHISVKNKISLAFIDAKNGSINSETLSPQNAQIQDPIWTDDGNFVVAVLSGRNGKALYKYSLFTQQWEEIIPWSFQNISMPMVSGDKIFYSSDISGTNNIYMVHATTKAICQVTQSTFGAFEPNYMEKDAVLFFSDYASLGFDIKSESISTALLLKPNPLIQATDPILQKAGALENFNLQDSIIPHLAYPAKHYSKLSHTFNLHSWAPFYFDYNNLQLGDLNLYPGLILLSQDKLGTCISSFGLSFENNNPVYRAKFTYKGWFPVIGFSVDYGSENPYASIVELDPQPTSKNYRAITNTFIYIPFNLTKGKYITTLIPKLNWKYDNRKIYNRESQRFVNDLNTLSAGLNFYKYVHLAYRDLAPANGIAFYSEYFFKPISQNVIGSRYYVKSRIYLPGLSNHHSFQITTGYFKQQVKDYMYSSAIAYPRGYNTGAPSELKTLTADYVLPLLYPDFNIGRFFYLKRIRANLFTDWCEAKYQIPTQSIGVYTKNTRRLLSSGIDIITDSHMLRFIFPVSLGIRTIYFPNQRTFSSYIIFSMDMNY
jgi:hypothetical protein